MLGCRFSTKLQAAAFIVKQALCIRRDRSSVPAAPRPLRSVYAAPRSGHTPGMATKKRPVTKSGTPRARKGVKLKPTALGPQDLALADPPPELRALAETVRADGGAVLATYREPLGGHALLLVALPVEKVERTPFQRDVSDGHVRRLTVAMDKTRRYLDPIIATR